MVSTKTRLPARPAGGRVHLQTGHQGLAEPPTKRVNETNAAVTITVVTVPTRLVQRQEQQRVQPARIALTGKESEKLRHHLKKDRPTRTKHINRVNGIPSRFATRHLLQRHTHLVPRERLQRGSLQTRHQVRRQLRRGTRTEESRKVSVKSIQTGHRIKRATLEHRPKVRRAGSPEMLQVPQKGRPRATDHRTIGPFSLCHNLNCRTRLTQTVPLRLSRHTSRCIPGLVRNQGPLPRAPLPGARHPSRSHRPA